VHPPPRGRARVIFRGNCGDLDGGRGYLGSSFSGCLGGATAKKGQLSGKKCAPPRQNPGYAYAFDDPRRRCSDSTLKLIRRGEQWRIHGGRSSPQTIKCMAFPLINLLWQDVSVRQTCKREAFCESRKAMKYVSGRGFARTSGGAHDSRPLSSVGSPIYRQMLWFSINKRLLTGR